VVEFDSTMRIIAMRKPAFSAFQDSNFNLNAQHNISIATGFWQCYNLLSIRHLK
jgi:hypothetical protein